MKICSKCHQRKEKSFFHKAKSAPDGYNYYCKDCNKKAVGIYRKRFPERVKQTQIHYRKKYKAKIMWMTAKTRAQKSGIPFNIDVNDIVIPETCPVFGWPLFIEGARQDQTASLDKVIPELGYTKGNIQVISDLANRMKSNANSEQLRNFANFILNLQ